MELLLLRLAGSWKVFTWEIFLHYELLQGRNSSLSFQRQTELLESRSAFSRLRFSFAGKLELNLTHYY